MAAAAPLGCCEGDWLLDDWLERELLRVVTPLGSPLMRRGSVALLSVGESV